MMRRSEIIRIINNAKVGGMFESAWRFVGHTPFSDGVRENYPVLTDAMAAEFVERAGRGVILNPDVEEIYDEPKRLRALDVEVELLRGEQRRRGWPETMIVPFGIFPRSDDEIRRTIGIFRSCGAFPIGGYIGNSPNRQQWGTIHGTTLDSDIARCIEDAERVRALDRRFFRRTPRIVWIHDHYVFPDYDADDPNIPEGQVGGWGSERPLLDEAVEAIDRMLRTRRDLFDGYQYWNEPGAPIDGRFIALGGRNAFEPSSMTQLAIVDADKRTGAGRVNSRARFARMYAKYREN